MMEKPMKSINIKGRMLEIRRPLVMGIINVTPDSFHAGSRVDTSTVALRAGEMLAAGADILDLGACSTRPGSDPVSAKQEMERLLPALEAIRESYPDAVISIDTFRACVARECVEDFGADIINDISGGDMDPEMWSAVADMKVPYVLMHTRGVPATMNGLNDYEDVVADVLRDLAFKTDRLRQLGVCDVIIDPGFGFAKDVAQNYRLLAELPAFSAIGAPILVGVSRKRMIQTPVGAGADHEETLFGTVAAGTIAMMQGADILRVHDVKACVAAVKVFDAYGSALPHPGNIITQSHHHKL